MEKVDITLRALEPADLDIVYRWENDPTLWHLGNTIAPLSRYQLDNYIRNYTADIYEARQLRLMIVTREEKTPVGTIDLYEFEPENSRAGLGIFIDPAWRRRGIATQALQHIISYCAGRLSIHSLWCVIDVDNLPSLALFRSNGFTASGRLRSWLRYNGAYHDALLLQLLNQ